MITFVLEKIVAAKLLEKFGKKHHEHQLYEQTNGNSNDTIQININKDHDIQTPSVIIHNEHTPLLLPSSSSSSALPTTIIQRQTSQSLLSSSPSPPSSLKLFRTSSKNLGELYQQAHDYYTNSDTPYSSIISLDSQTLPPLPPKTAAKTTATTKSNDNNNNSNDSSNSVVVALTLFGVLAIHSFFEGTAIGVQVWIYDCCPLSVFAAAIAFVLVVVVVAVVVMVLV